MSLRSGILGLLTKGPTTGYGLKKVFDQSIGYLWTASLSQIYRELGTLEKKGLIRSAIEEQDDKPDKKIYTITDDGKKTFVEWLTDFPENLSSVKRDDFMLRIFFGADLEKEQLIDQLERFIKQKQNYIVLLDQLWAANQEKKTAETEKEMLFWHFTIRRAKMTLDTAITWARECILQLKEAQFK